MGTGGCREGIRSRPKALIAWLWKRSVEESSAENQNQEKISDLG